jgi:SM-20-related protein
LKDGDKLRKFTVIIYLNPDLDKVSGPESKKQLGELRLYLPDKIVDVMPHMGRIIVFRSDQIEHEVRPTTGYQRFALTTWYRHIHKEEEVKKEEASSDDDTIFIGIPAYRDP